MAQVFRAARLFDGTDLRDGACLLVDGARVVGITEAPPTGAVVHDLGAGIIAPGLVDLQVNGGGGVMLGASGAVAGELGAIRTICAAHAQLGATAILPTLITDRAEVTEAVIAAGIEAAARGVPGFAGLHLEGPHLDPARKGAHDADLIRPMGAADVAALTAAARALPALMITLAPIAADAAQIAALAGAGVVVSLGHSDATEAESRAAIAAGARCGTHLFNAMSQLGNREPGLVGAILDTRLPAGLIADGVHVADACLRIALGANPNLFLVSDAMAVAGTDIATFTLGGREIGRAGGRLTLADGTLAGADTTLPQSLAVLRRIGIDPARALAMATRLPADLIGAGDRGRLRPGARADFVHLDEGMRLLSVWRDGVPLAAPAAVSVATPA